MKVSYKIALFAAVVFFAVVGVYFLTRGDETGSGSQTPLPTATTSTIKTPASTSTASTNPIKPKPLATDAGNRNNDLNDLVRRQLEQISKANNGTPSPTSTGTPKPLPGSVTPAPMPTPTPLPKPTTLTFDSTPPVDNVLAPTPAPGSVTPPVITTPTPPAPKPLPTPTPVSRSTTYPTSYTIQSGDTLSSIALTLYGSDRHWVEIAQANPTIDPLKLKPGAVIKLPLPAELRKPGTQRVTAPTPSGKGTQYTVRAGDNLSTIAQEFYNNSGLWRRIYNANKDAIGSNPDTLQAGVTLDIPPVDSGSGN